MKGEPIIFKWINKGKEYSRELNRDDMFVVFEGLANGFQNDNEISKEMIRKVIPETDIIFVDMDVNSTQDIPFIVYIIDGKEEVLKILRHHKIVWAILDKYCI